MGTFEELQVYQLAREFRIEISALAKQLPKSERYRLSDQIIRSSRSVTAQIAEGYGRFHYQESTQFCRISRGSLDETHEHLNVALDEGYIQDDQYQFLINKKVRITQVLNGYIRYLQTSKRGS